ncbi:hypothetical protein BUALT_Bualt17G0040500 [Buddleja alternifolia]|uniref:HAT C-terminal dimerisation domain-containing protein n=1 Tax=Buddleja alternifolia TaxID=168488 RepID=A0AAV6WCA3_9LAMI|nr:hypothetical protein BUALT_Bualt17G0040500 [Buddleja alternifolia]
MVLKGSMTNADTQLQAEIKELLKEASSLSHVEHILRNTAKGDVLKVYEAKKEKLKTILASVSSRICLTSDLWSSIVSNGYMTITAHYVDDNQVLQKKMLIFRHLLPPHDGQSIGEKLVDFLQEWGIERKVFTITLDNARYPELALMARDILSIPITTVASESAFSHGSRIIGKFHSSILPKNTEAILCSCNWLEAYNSEIEEEELSTDIETLVSKLGNYFHSKVIEDVYSLLLKIFTLGGRLLMPWIWYCGLCSQEAGG